MPAVMNRYMQRLRSVKFAWNVTHVDAPLSLSAIQANGQVTITALELCGVEYHNAQDVNHAANEDVSVMAVSAPTPGKIVLWCTEGKNRKGNSTSSAPLPSYNMTEESMDDEGNVVTWSCVWPDEASAVDVPFSVSYRDGQQSDITVHVGVQRIDGRQEIEPLGYAIISLPEPELSELNEQRPQQSASLQSVPLGPKKLKKRISSRFGSRNRKKKPLSNECSVSPSTELKLELKVAWENTPSAATTSSAMFEDTELMKECLSVDTNSTSHSATSTQAGMDYELKLEQHFGVDNLISSNDSHTGSRRTVRATNTTTTPVPINDEPDGYSIESEDSVLDGAVTKECEVVDVAPLGQELLGNTQFFYYIVHTGSDDMPDVVLENADPITGGGIINNDICTTEEPGQPRYSVGELNTGAGALGDIPEDETLLTVELERTDSDLSTLDLSKAEFPEQQEKKNPHTPIVLFGSRCHELTSCKAQAEEIWDDAVEGKCTTFYIHYYLTHTCQT